MVEHQIRQRGVTDPAVLSAMALVPRHRFIPEDNQDLAYRDGPVGIGRAQTISQPYVVAFMSEALNITLGTRVLEIGTGSGYQTAVLAQLGARVHSVEIIPELSERATAVLNDLGYEVQTQVADGFEGWPEAAPFDAIIVTAAPTVLPPPLFAQLRMGGQIIIPLGERTRQTLWRIRRTPNGPQQEEILPVLFVPMTGRAGEQ